MNITPVYGQASRNKKIKKTIDMNINRLNENMSTAECNQTDEGQSVDGFSSSSGVL